jgi:hypothetical protein
MSQQAQVPENANAQKMVRTYFAMYPRPNGHRSVMAEDFHFSGYGMWTLRSLADGREVFLAF